MFHRCVLIIFLVTISSAIPVYVLNNDTDSDGNGVNNTSAIENQNGKVNLNETYIGLLNITIDEEEGSGTDLPTDMTTTDCEMNEDEPSSTIGPSSETSESAGLQQAANAGAGGTKCERNFCWIGPIGWICLIIIVSEVLGIALYAGLHYFEYDTCH